MSQRTYVIAESNEMDLAEKYVGSMEKYLISMEEYL